MRINQYSYFAVKSASLSAAVMATRIGMEPDEVQVMGSRSIEHVLPRVHAWKIVCRSAESVDDQIQHLVNRLEPVRAQLVSLCSDGEVSSVLQIVRYFGDVDGVEASCDGMESAQAQRWPRPLGWHVPLSTLEFLVSTRSHLDVDEYLLDEDDQGELGPGRATA